MIDGIFISKIKKELDVLKGGRINKIYSSLETEYVLSIKKEKNNYKLLISLSSSYSRIHLTYKDLEESQNKNFLTILKKNIEGYFIKDINTYSSDRVIYLTLEGATEFEGKKTKYLYAEIMGRYSNMILTKEDNTIIESLHHDGIGEYNRIIMPNSKYEFPISNKINPINLSYEEINDIFTSKEIDSPKKLTNIFNGISMLLAENIFLANNPSRYFYETLNKDINPSTFKYKDKTEFYFDNLNYEIIDRYESLSLMLDEYYYQMDLKSKINKRTDNLESFIKKQIKKHESKLIKLNEELIDASSKDLYKLYGELLLTYPNLKEKKKEVNVLNYYNNLEINIPLDEKYNIIENSNRYYKKYQKMKASISHINDQIDVSNAELDYFNLLLSQLKCASVEDSLEIKDELIKNKYIFENTKEKKNKNKKPNILRYKIDDYIIYVGKNNIQNDYITNKLAKKDWYWFHVKNSPSSHVVISTDNLDEKLIRTCAMLTAKYSLYSLSSSIEVDYTQIKNIKKIPGKKNCFIRYTKEKSIFIDIDEEYLKSLEKI